MMNSPLSILATGIIASVGSTMSDNPWISSVGEKVGVICIMGYFLWEKTKECKAQRLQIEELHHKDANKCPSCELAKAANRMLIEDDEK